MKQTQDELAAVKQELAEEKYNYSTLTIISQQLNQQLETERADRQQLQTELAELQQRLDTTEQNPPPVIELPESADLLNQLKAKNPKSKASLGDADAMVEIIEEFWKTHPGFRN